jgi:hypothetical protein
VLSRDLKARLLEEVAPASISVRLRVRCEHREHRAAVSNPASLVTFGRRIPHFSDDCGSVPQRFQQEREFASLNVFSVRLVSW